MTNDPVPAVAVSPKDQSSDRMSADANQVANVESNKSDREQSDANRAQADADQSITVERLDRLIEVSAALTAGAVGVAAATRQELAIATSQRRRVMLVLFAVAAMMLTLLIPLLIIGVSGVRARNELKDCVTPTGQCFKDATARTGQAVSDLNKVTLLAAACAPDYANLPIAKRTAAISKCIEAGLK